MECLDIGWDWLCSVDREFIGLIAFIVITGWIIFRWKKGVFLPRPKKKDNG